MAESSNWLSFLPSAQAIGPWVIQGLSLLAILVGIMLWLMGKRLARPACAGVWVILGMMLAAGVCHLFGDGGLLPLWLVVGGIAGGALGWLVYRLCLAMALCIVLGLSAPAAAHFLHGSMPRPDLTDDTQELVEAVKDEARQTREHLAQDEGRLTFADVKESIARIAQGPWQKLQSHWDDLPDQARKTLLAAAGIGALAGLILGLIFPSLGAAAGSSLLGTLFMAGGSVAFFAQYNPSLLDALNDRTPICLLALGLITILGIGIQWTLKQRKTDN